MNLDEAKIALSHWMEDGRQALATTAAELDFLTAIEVPMRVVQLSDNSASWTITTESRLANVLELAIPYTRIVEKFVPPKAREAREIAEAIFKGFPYTWKFWSPWGPAFMRAQIRELLSGKEPTASMEAVDWLAARMLLPLMLQYARKCRDLGVPDETLRFHMIEDAFAFVSGRHWTHVERIAIRGVRTQEPLVWNDVRLRPLAGWEMGAWLSGPPFLEDFGAVSGSAYLQRPGGPYTHLLEIRAQSRVEKTQQPLPENLIPRLLVALQLLGFEPGAPGLSEHVVEPEWASIGRRGFPSRLPSTGGEVRAITGSDLEEAWVLSQKVSSGDVTEATEVEDLAVRRFSVALRRDNALDCLIDLTIALEVMLLPKIQHELSFRFQLHGALWLEDDTARRAAAMKQLENIYEVRSKIVHGIPVARQQVVELVTQAKALVRCGISKALSDGWPTREFFRDACLGFNEPPA